MNQYCSVETFTSYFGFLLKLFQTFLDLEFDIKNQDSNYFLVKNSYEY
ncbi:hypothetical protein SAMN05444483_11136 [Salegentibacter echinorum]|uniref:Uncharacterized protein n=1 Tax=Salegentibacter echinorum TaxID=1073325 RepID=A0A1M5JKN8_SALEC|nr:hypothetical protein SAMN05444483_11136 [Salegentibacter echinorum]